MGTRINRDRPKRCAVFVLAFLLADSAVAVVWGQSPTGVPAGTRSHEPVTPSAAAASVPRTEVQANLVREDLEALRAQIDAKLAQVRIGQSRLEQARKWEAYYAKLLKEGKVTEDRYLAAQDDVLMLEAHVASEKADVKLAEMRMRFLQRRLESGATPSMEVDARLSDLLMRMMSVERKLDLLQHEVGRMRRQIPGESPTSHH